MSNSLDYVSVWKNCVDELEQLTEKPTFETCIKNIVPLGYDKDSDVLHLGATEFSLNVLNKKPECVNLIELLLKKSLSPSVRTKFSEISGSGHADVPPPPPPEPPREEKRQPQQEEKSKFSYVINKKYQFENFVVGESNTLAYSACYAVASQPGRGYNPLFIYGGVGLGKTHLLQAIANTVLQKNPDCNLEYTSAENFTDAFITHLKRNKMDDFKRKYRNLDFLLIDDIQFLQGKDETQNEFFSTFNELHRAGKQIVISSDRPPKAIPNITDRLTSRFESGLKVDIQPPDIETRQAILVKKAEVEKIHVPKDVIYFIAENINTNIRELEGALVTVIARASIMNGGVIDIATAQQALKDVLSDRKDRKVTVEEIQKCTAKYFGIDVADLKSPKRDQKFSVPRHIAMYLTREETNMSYMDIARAFNKNDHTTIKHAYEKIQSSLDSSTDETKNSIKNILDMLKG